MCKNLGKNISKKLSRKYSKKILGHAKKSVTDAIKTVQWIWKTEKATGDLIRNKTADKITKYSKSWPWNCWNNNFECKTEHNEYINKIYIPRKNTTNWWSRINLI